MRRYWPCFMDRGCASPRRLASRSRTFRRPAAATPSPSPARATRPAWFRYSSRCCNSLPVISQSAPMSACRLGCALAAPRAKIASGRARNSRRRASIGAGELGDHPFHRPAWRELHHRERHQHDPEQGRDHEEDATDNVSGHLAPRFSIWIMSPPRWAKPRPAIARFEGHVAQARAFARRRARQETLSSS